MNILDQLREKAEFAEDENYNPELYWLLINAIKSEKTIEEFALEILDRPFGDFQ